MLSVSVGPYIISADIVESSTDAFLFGNPIPVDENGDPVMNTLEWFEEWLRLRLIKELALCRYKYAESNLSYDPASDDDVIVGG